ncbi:follistatin-like [Hydractinia symbiolongicarpus]|uniref:follistatin-like n=1 Tax=Hydractinia symbiolongicarpus TaxID=13093 RepID=UPI0025506061|nr:follistatin-like [Hydractinia symbiolongicarpus]
MLVAVFIIAVSLSLIVSVQSQVLLPSKETDSICYQHRCSVGKICQVINHKPICKCNHNCKDSEKTGPLCAKNGRTYKHLCQLKRHECQLGQYIKVEHYGNCSKAVPCFDKERERKLGLCTEWAAFGSCEHHKELMEKYCRKTCGMCDEKQLPNVCDTTKYGCCHGSKLPALGPQQKGCYSKGARCKDGSQCRFFPHFCGNDINMNTMRKYCPYTCRFCVPSSTQEEFGNDKL